MGRALIAGILALLLVILFQTDASAYQVQLNYLTDANYSYVRANNESLETEVYSEAYSDDTASVQIDTGSTENQASATATARQGNPNDATHWIINVVAQAGPTETDSFAYSYGMGESLFSFRITKQAGDTQNQVTATLDYHIAGLIAYGDAGTDPNRQFNSTVNYSAQVKDFYGAGLPLVLLPNTSATWQGANFSDSGIQDQGVIQNLILAVDTDYYCHAYLDADVNAIGQGIPGEGLADFKAYFCISDIEPAPIPVPGSFLLLATGLAGLAGFSWRWRG